MSRCCPPRIPLLVQIHRSSQHRHRRKQTNVAAAAVHASTLHAALTPLTDIMVDFSIAKFMIHQSMKAYNVNQNQIMVELIKFGIEMTNAALVGALLARYKKINNRSR